jgi:hypothetical protein
MAKDQKPADKTSPFSIEQTHQALDAYFDFLKKSVSHWPSDGTTVGAKLKDHTTENIAVVHELVKKLRQAKDLEEVLRLQMEFMQSQLSAFGMLAVSLSEEHLRAAADTAKKARSRILNEVASEASPAERLANVMQFR